MPFKKGHLYGKRFKKGQIAWNKGKSAEWVKGEKHPSWKGGRYKTAEDYIYILNPKHPFCTKDGYIREHRFVMEQKLGRYLIPKEKVHHINGIKDDNRIENLKLFINLAEHTRFHFPHPINPIKKGEHCSPNTEFKKGDKPPHTGIKGWTNSGSFKKGHKPYIRRITKGSFKKGHPYYPHKNL